MYVRLLLSLLCILGSGALADASPFAYVANYNEDSVTRIDLSQTSNNTMIIQLPGAYGPYGVAVNRFGSRVYVSSSRTDSSGSLGKIISVIDTAENTVATIPLNFRPGALAVNSAGTRLYVADPDNDSLAVFDALTGTFIKSVTVGTSPSMASPSGVAVSGNTVYVASSPRTSLGGTPEVFKDAVHVFDASNDSMNHVRSINVDLLPIGLAVNAAGDRLYVACADSHKINKINLATDAVTVIPANGSGITINRPIGVALTGDGSKAYVTLANEDTVAVINTATDTINAQRITAGRSPMGIAITPDSSKVVVANSNSATASIINPVTNTVVASSTVGDAPQSLGNFAGPELVPVYFPYPYNGSVTPAEPISLDGLLMAQVPKGNNLPLNVQPGTNHVVGTIKDITNNVVLTHPYTLTNVTGEREITASFTRVARDVNVTKKGNGTGRVYTTAPASPFIDCGTACPGASATYPLSATVSMSAQADPGMKFQGWAGAMCSGTSMCHISIGNGYPSPDGNYNVEAYFMKASDTTLQGAYDAAASGAAIDCVASYTTETSTSFVANRNVIVTLNPASPSTTLTAPNFFTVQYGTIIIGSGGTFIIK